MANVDDNGFTASGSLLKPQTSHDTEIAAEFKTSAAQVRAAAFESRVTNEIHFLATPSFGFFLGFFRLCDFGCLYRFCRCSCRTRFCRAFLLRSFSRFLCRLLGRLFNRLNKFTDFPNFVGVRQNNARLNDPDFAAKGSELFDSYCKPFVNNLFYGISRVFYVPINEFLDS